MDKYNLIQTEQIANERLDEFVKILRLSSTEEEVFAKLVKEFDLTPVQAEHLEGLTIEQMKNLGQSYETMQIPSGENVEDFIADIMQGKNELSKSDHKICRTLIECMSDDELGHLYEHVEMDWYLNNLVHNRLYKDQPQEKTREHNKSWSEYFEDIRERKIGKVIKAREVLRKAFPSQEWRKQRELLRFFLTEGTKTDRVWALNILLEDWALVGDTEKSELNSWHDLLLQTWTTHRDILAARIIVNHLPLETVKEKEHELSDAVGYQRVALRLSEMKAYKIEREKLTTLEYLYLMAKLGRTMKEDEARELLYDVIYSAICSYRENPDSAMITHHTDEEGLPQLFSDSNIGLAIWCLGQMKHTKLIMELYRREEALRKYIAEHTSSPKDYVMMLCDLAEEFTNKK